MFPINFFKDFIQWISHKIHVSISTKKVNSCVMQVILRAQKTVNLSVWSWFNTEWNVFSMVTEQSFFKMMKIIVTCMNTLCHTDTRIVWHKERWIVWHKELWTVWLEYEVIQSQEKTHWYKCTSTILSRHFWNNFNVILNS